MQRYQRSWVEINIAANTAEELVIPCPGEGKWLLIGADFEPFTTSAADATDYTELSLKNKIAGTSVATVLSTATVAFTVGTRRAWTLTNNTSREFDDDTGEYLGLEKDDTGTAGAIAAGLVIATWERIRA